MYGHRPAEAITPLDPDRWEACEDYLFGIDLFNHGYYWEAHEAWEALWHAAGRTGTTGDFLKGLIKLAAAAVKAREGSLSGAARHARRAHELVRSVAATVAAPPVCYAGLSLATLEKFTTGLEFPPAAQSSPKQVFDVVLLPG
jgi:predicted metal-dependent hydrolase